MRPFSIIVRMPPGSLEGQVAHTQGEVVTGVLEQQVAVENRPRKPDPRQQQRDGRPLPIGVMPGDLAHRLLSGQAFVGNTGVKAI